MSLFSECAHYIIKVLQTGLKVLKTNDQIVKRTWIQVYSEHCAHFLPNQDYD